ncbi:MAG TPA: RNA methyltransferase [Bacteroidota bacterium]|nr:RNA methyltransferase [Bacteroidota bacterium]
MLSKTKLQYLKSFSQKKQRDKEGLFLIEGWRSIEEACAASAKIDLLLYTKEAKAHSRYGSVLSSASKASQEKIEISDKELSMIADTVTAQGVAALIKKIPYDTPNELERLSQRERALVVGLDQIADPGNLGAIIRTADWFGVDALLLSPKCVEVYNPKVVRSTVGSLFHTPILECEANGISFEDILGKMGKNGFKILGADVSGKTDLRNIVWPKKSVLVIGNEARGISAEVSDLLDEHIAIPQFGKAESLNAGVAAGVFLSHHSFQTRK